MSKVRRRLLTFREKRVREYFFPVICGVRARVESSPVDAPSADWKLFNYFSTHLFGVRLTRSDGKKTYAYGKPTVFNDGKNVVSN